MTQPPSVTAAEFRRLVADGMRLARAGDHGHAATAFEAATRLAPGAADAWRALGDMRHRLADHGAANTAHLRAADLSRREPELAALIRAIDADRPADAAPPLAERLRRKPTDVVALLLAARLNLRLGRAGDAAAAALRMLALAPGLAEGWPLMRDILHAMPPAEALQVVVAQARQRPDIGGWQALEPAMHERTGDYEQARLGLERLVQDRPDTAGGWIALGHIRKTLGDGAGAIAAYRRAVALAPASGAAWWALADLKTFPFDAADIAAMQAAEAGTGGEDRAMLGLALARALEQAGDSEAAFAAYADANRRRRAVVTHDREALGRELAGVKAAFQSWQPDEPADAGADTPIFIVGMPRSGSTLVEQILASHPLVEATRELDELPLLARELMLATRASSPSAAVVALGEEERRAWGARYIERTRCQRRTTRPYFIDKLPANFRHIGLIRLILPHARIIDVRRDAVACGFSIYKQWFAGGYTFANDLEDIAAWRRDYVAFMRFWDAWAPGFVTHVDHDALVADPETAIRTMLAALDLPFDPACLRPHETVRPIRTPSGDQVRTPIGTQWQGAWRPYAPWLTALEEPGPVAL